MAEKENRAPRELDGREATKRAEEWAPPSALPVPGERDGYVHRWVRTAIGNEADRLNVSKRFQEHWRPVSAAEYPEVASHVDPLTKGNGTVEFGGLILCKMPVEVAKQRDAYYLRMALGQIDAVDNTIFRTEDRRMPVMPPERKTRISSRMD